MSDAVDLLKSQGRVLGAYLMLDEGFRLSHSHCLHAVAAMHGHRDWGSFSRLLSAASADTVASLLASPLRAQADRLAAHMSKRYGLHLDDRTDAIAAIRWGSLVEQLDVIVGDPLRASNWLKQGHAELEGRSAIELVETDEGFEQLQRLLHETGLAAAI